jgi:histidinol-phosphate aminotransferase
MMKELEALGYKPLPSQTNFLFAQVPGGDGRGVYEHLKQAGILVRYFDLEE